MKYVILGATGPTGLLLVEECLEQGHVVTALVRNPDKIEIKHENLSVYHTDISNEEELKVRMTGSDAVLSCLGSPSILWYHCSLYSSSIRTITAAMKKAGVDRLVLISSWATKYDVKLQWYLKWLVRPILLRNILLDMGRMEDYLINNCKDIDFTVVRPPCLSNDPSTGKQVTAVEAQNVPDVDLFIPRRDVAKFMLQCVVKGEWKKKQVAIGISHTDVG